MSSAPVVPDHNEHGGNFCNQDKSICSSPAVAQKLSGHRVCLHVCLCACVCVCVGGVDRNSLGDQAWLASTLLQIITIARNYSQIVLHSAP